MKRWRYEARERFGENPVMRKQNRFFPHTQMKPGLIECPSCALETEAGAETCPYCGYEFPAHRTGLPAVAWLLVLLLLLPVLWFLLQLIS